jgi:hypothetical protein
VIGAVAAGVVHDKPSNRTIDNVVVPIGGFVAGSIVGNSIAIATVDAFKIEHRLASIGLDVASLGAGYAVFQAWQKDKKHTMAGSVGMGILASWGTNVALRVIDRNTTKFIPPSVPELLAMEAQLSAGAK